MIAATIGRTFLKVFNEKTGQNMSAKEFFEKKFHSFFYDHPKYMQWITNSPFVQGLSADPKGEYGVREKVKDAGGKTLTFASDAAAYDFLNNHIKTKDNFLYCNEAKDKKKVSAKGIEYIRILNQSERKKMLSDFTEKVNRLVSLNSFDGSIAIGFPASDLEEYATTSGLVSDIKLQFEESDIYFSWIGNGLGIGVEGGFSIFFDNGEILYSIYEGWQHYREILNDKSISIVGNQIDTWNGQWLAFRYNEKNYREDFDFSTLNQNGFFKETKEEFKVDTVFWAKIAFSLSFKFHNNNVLGCIYSYGDVNKTLGFYPFHFEKARTLKKYYTLLFGEHAAITDAKQYEALFGIHIKRACELGSIGLQALEPKDLRKYFGNESNLKLTKPKEDKDEEKNKKNLQKDYENIITYRTYKTWLIAMITKNKEESLEYTAEVAKALHEYRDKASKNDRKNLIDKELLGAKTKKTFLDALATIIKDIDKEALEDIKKLRDRVHLMSVEDFGYFVVLLKFDYAYVEREQC